MQRIARESRKKGDRAEGVAPSSAQSPTHRKPYDRRSEDGIRKTPRSALGPAPWPVPRPAHALVQGCHKSIAWRRELAY